MYRINSIDYYSLSSLILLKTRHFHFTRALYIHFHTSFTLHTPHKITPAQPLLHFTPLPFPLLIVTIEMKILHFSFPFTLLIAAPLYISLVQTATVFTVNSTSDVHIIFAGRIQDLAFSNDGFKKDPFVHSWKIASGSTGKYVAKALSGKQKFYSAYLYVSCSILMLLCFGFFLFMFVIFMISRS